MHQLLSLRLYFMFLFPFYCIKILSHSYGYVEMSNHPKFCLVEEKNIPKNTNQNLEINALVHHYLNFYYIVK